MYPTNGEFGEIAETLPKVQAAVDVERRWSDDIAAIGSDINAVNDRPAWHMDAGVSIEQMPSWARCCDVGAGRQGTMLFPQSFPRRLVVNVNNDQLGFGTGPNSDVRCLPLPPLEPTNVCRRPM